MANHGDPLKKPVSLENVLVGVGGQPVLSNVCSPSCGELEGAGIPKSLSWSLMVNSRLKRD